MKNKFKIYDKKNKKIIKYNDKTSVFGFIIFLIENKENERYVLLEDTGIFDKTKKSVFNGDYILFDSGVVRNFLKVQRKKTNFSFYKWDKDKKRWKKSTCQGIDTYGKVIGNIYEGIKFKRLYYEMLELGIDV